MIKNNCFKSYDLETKTAKLTAIVFRILYNLLNNQSSLYL